MNQDHASAPQAGETMLNTQATPGRPIAYDKAISFNICDRFGNGESLEAILAEPGMPDKDTFFRWLDEFWELRRQFRAKEELCEILAEQEMAMEAEETEKRSEAKYRARRWTEMYPLIGPRPALPTESEQAYADLLTALRSAAAAGHHHADLCEAGGGCHLARGARYIREKMRLPEPEYRE